MCKLLLHAILESIKNVPKEYYAPDNIVLYERGFSYEFYHQVRNLMDSIQFIKQMGIIFSGEAPKDIRLMLDEKFNEHDYDETKFRLRYPDFVLHGGLKNKNQEEQLIVIEMKHNKSMAEKTKVSKINKTPLCLDIWKLCVLLKKINFKIGVFIAIGMNTKEMISLFDDNKIKDELLKFENDNILDKLYFIATDINDNEPWLLATDYMKNM